MRTLFLFIVLMIAINTLFAQQQFEQLEETQFKVISKVENSQIFLRWAPISVEAWYYIREKGMVIELLETKQGENETGIFEVIPPMEYAPWDSLEFDKNMDLISNSPEMLIVAQCLLGEDETYSDDRMDDLLTKASYFEDCYHATLMSADLNFNAAIASGLGYKQVLPTDNDLVFKLFIDFESEDFISDTIIHYVSRNQSSIKIKPVLDTVISEEDAVILKWSERFDYWKFSAYNVERSNDGVSYENINPRPFISAEPSEYFYIDSLINDNNPYYYRIRGIDAFGSISEPSNVIVGKVSDLTPPDPPNVTLLEQKETGEVIINWEQNETFDLVGFDILIRKDEGTQRKINKDRLGRNSRSFIYKLPELGNKNYFQIVAIDTAGNISRSFEKYLFIIDNIPPEKPKWDESISKISKDGKLSLFWQPNIEKDLHQYRIYFANDINHEFIHLTTIERDKRSFVDHIPLDNLSHKIYFKLKAIDSNYNSSEFSEILELKKPDTIPPSAPAFWDYTINNDHIVIQWVPSNSVDVLYHELRRQKGIGGFTVIKTFESNSSPLFKDYDLGSESEVITYKIYAFDNEGNVSECFQPLILKSRQQDKKLVKPIIAFSSDDGASIKITNADEYEIQEFRILKSVNGGPFVTIKVSNSSFFHDDRISKDKTYSYRVQAINQEGSESEFSDILEFKK